MAATKLQKGWSSVTIGGATVAEVQSVAFGKGGQLLPHLSDADITPRVIAVQSSHPHGTVVSNDMAALQGYNVGDNGAIVATTPDALGATGGAITWTLANAFVQNVDVSGQWGAYGTGTITVLAASTDGTTPPLSITLA